MWADFWITSMRMSGKARHNRKGKARMEIQFFDNTLDFVADSLPIAVTGGSREASALVTNHVGPIEQLGEKMFENLVGAVIKRSRLLLSMTT
jgi:hypothetical protein